MLNLLVIGTGNCGGQVAGTTFEKYNIPAAAINCSEVDLSTLPEDLIKIHVVSKVEDSEGSGQDREKAKEYAKENAAYICSNEELTAQIISSDLVFVVGSTSGGYGSGSALPTCKLLDMKFKKEIPEAKIVFIPVNVTPSLKSSKGELTNTLGYLDGLTRAMQGYSYMSFSNDKYSNLQMPDMYDAVNNEIADDIHALSAYYNKATKYSSIDKNDMKRLLSVPGRIVVSQLFDVKESDVEEESVEDLLLNKIKKSAHTELTKDKHVGAYGIITNLSENVEKSLDTSLGKVRAEFGETTFQFTHIYRNEDRKDENHVILIMSGLSPVKSYITKIQDRLEDIEATLSQVQADEADINADFLNQIQTTIKSVENQGKAVLPTTGDLDVDDIFGEF